MVAFKNDILKFIGLNREMKEAAFTICMHAMLSFTWAQIAKRRGVARRDKGGTTVLVKSLNSVRYEGGREGSSGTFLRRICACVSCYCRNQISAREISSKTGVRNPKSSRGRWPGPLKWLVASPHTRPHQTFTSGYAPGWAELVTLALATRQFNQMI